MPLRLIETIIKNYPYKIAHEGRKLVGDSNKSAANSNNLWTPNPEPGPVSCDRPNLNSVQVRVRVRNRFWTQQVTMEEIGWHYLLLLPMCRNAVKMFKWSRRECKRHWKHWADGGQSSAILRMCYECSLNEWNRFNARPNSRLVDMSTLGTRTPGSVGIEFFPCWGTDSESNCRIDPPNTS
jgi:hypothetical protein